MIKRSPGSTALLALLFLVAGCVSQPAKETTGTPAKGPISTDPVSAYQKEKSHLQTASDAKFIASSATQSDTVKNAPTLPSSQKVQAVGLDKEGAAEKPVTQSGAPTWKQTANKPWMEPRADSSAAIRHKTSAPAVSGMRKPDYPETLVATVHRGPSDAPPEHSVPTPLVEELSLDKVAEAETPEQSPVQPAPAETQETQLAMIEKTAPSAPPETKPAELIYDDEQLPIMFPGGWVLDRGRDWRGGATRCLVFSPTVSMFDGYEQTEVKLQVTLNAVLVEAQSNIDISYPGQGLSVDGAELVPFEAGLVSERVIHTMQPVQTAMAGGERLTVALGFWPSWPVTEIQQVSLRLDGFELAYTALQSCAEQQ